MRQIFTLSLFFLGLFITQAQFTVATDEGDPIIDGSVFTYSETGEEDGKITFNITNTGSSTIEMKLEFVSMNNTDGTGTFLCLFGNCLPPGGITPGGVYSGPNNTVAAGATSTTDNHFYNTNAGDGTNYPMEFVFRLFQVDGSGVEIGDSITFTYRYDPDAAIEDFNQVSYQLFPNLSNDYVNLVIDETVSGKLINNTGQIVKQYRFNAGINKIDVRSFSQQLYYLVLTNKNGATSLAKIVVK
jgi:hypothetical protein